MSYWYNRHIVRLLPKYFQNSRFQITEALLSKNDKVYCTTNFMSIFDHIFPICTIMAKSANKKVIKKNDKNSSKIFDNKKFVCDDKNSNKIIIS